MYLDHTVSITLKDTGSKRKQQANKQAAIMNCEEEGKEKCL